MTSTAEPAPTSPEPATSTGPTLEINDRPYQAGDQIVCLRNNRRLGIHNGTRATITEHRPRPPRHHHPDQPRRGQRLPAEYVDAGHIAHGYATTIHKTQGATVDRGLLLGTDELFRERGYVAMSRGRLSNHLYLLGATPADDPAGHGPPAPTLEPTDAVRQALHRQSEQRLAIDTGEPSPLARRASSSPNDTASSPSSRHARPTVATTSQR